MEHRDNDGPLLVYVVGRLEKSIESLRRRVSDRHDCCVGRTVKGMPVRRRCSSDDTWKKMNTLRKMVSNNHEGCAGRTVVLMMV